MFSLFYQSFLRCAPLAIRTVVDFLKNKPESLRLVRFCLFSDADLEVYTKALTEVKSD